MIKIYRMIRKVVFPAAGFGTRMLPLSKSIPKEMLPLVDKPVIQWAVEEALAAGFSQFIFVVGRNKHALEDYFDHDPELEQVLEKEGKKELLEKICKISALIDPIFVRQKIAKGLGHAVGVAKEAVAGEPFAVILPDDLVYNPTNPAVLQLKRIFEKYNFSVVAVCRVPVDQVSRYGIVKAKNVSENLYEVEDLIEKPAPEEAPSNLAIVGRYIFTPTIFEMIEQTPPGRGGEIQITDAMRLLLSKEKIYAVELQGDRYDVGNIEGYIKAFKELSER